MRLKTIHFTANSSFLETTRLEFESHLGGLTSSLPQDFEDNTHQPAVEGEDDGVQLVKLRGLAFVPCVTAEIVLEQGSRVPITEVISRTFAGPRIQNHAYDPSLDLMQASFTAHAESTYTGHIRTRR